MIKASNFASFLWFLLTVAFAIGLIVLMFLWFSLCWNDVMPSFGLPHLAINQVGDLLFMVLVLQLLTRRKNEKESQ